MIYTLIILLFSFFINEESENKLITIYDKDCGYCQDLLHKTYQNDEVSEALSTYEHQLFEANSEAGKVMMKKYKVTSFPTQIIVSNDDETYTIRGFLNAKQQLNFLEAPDFVEVASQMESKDSGLSDGAKVYICSGVRARRSFEDILKRVEVVTKREGIKYKNIDKFVSDSSGDIVCKNVKAIKMREKTSLFKYALDIGNYQFVEDLIDHDKDGKCNPNIDYAQKETLEDGTEEDLMGFLDKIIDDYNSGGGSNAVHDISALKRVRAALDFCLETR